MSRAAWGLFLLTAILLSSKTVQAQNAGDDGYTYYPRCVAFFNALDHSVPPDQPVNVGECFGFIHGVVAMYHFYSPEWTFCPPDGDDTKAITAMRVVVAWLAKHPEHMPRHFAVIALAAMREAWPCHPGK
jgi:hypothetical protein